MRILVIGSAPLPQEFRRALEQHHTADICSLRENILFRIASKQYDCTVIWSQNVSYLMLKKVIQYICGRFPSLKLFICGCPYSSLQRAALLAAGARDCIPGSSCKEELLIKIAAADQTDSQPRQTVFTQGDFAFDFAGSTASYRGDFIPLNKKEALILSTLLRRNNRLIPKQLIYDLVWNETGPPSSNSLEVYISSLRRKIEKPFKITLIECVKGVGYRVKS